MKLAVYDEDPGRDDEVGTALLRVGKHWGEQNVKLTYKNKPAGTLKVYIHKINQHTDPVKA